MIKLFNIDDASWQEDMDLVEKLIKEMNEDTMIRLQGDVDENREVKISNSVGQGTTGAKFWLV